jgi:hypothetical protein
VDTSQISVSDLRLLGSDKIVIPQIAELFLTEGVEYEYQAEVLHTTVYKGEMTKKSN